MDGRPHQPANPPRSMFFVCLHQNKHDAWRCDFSIALPPITTVPATAFRDVNDSDVKKELIGERVDASEAIENMII